LRTQTSLRYAGINLVSNYQQRQGEKMTVVCKASIRKYLLSGVILMATSTFAASNLYNFTLPNIDGKPMPLADFKGKVILMVNVASQCGFTPQYSALETIYEKYKDQGFVILGFPANNFGQQEPGTNEEIKTFCSRKYSVTSLCTPRFRSRDRIRRRSINTSPKTPTRLTPETSSGTSPSFWSTATAMWCSASNRQSPRIPPK